MESSREGNCLGIANQYADFLSFNFSLNENPNCGTQLAKLNGNYWL